MVAFTKEGIKIKTAIVPRWRLAQIIKQTNGKFFKVLFIKRTNGEYRSMLCRTGVKKHLKGGSLRYDASTLKLINVYDINKKGYRSINLETLVSAKIGGVEYVVS